ncbi:hypothetical protein B0H10DRAFT_1948764 [Mycena sp. CBHHK59/15]|nr:hypothetical protein B0H10DRAFT_1948764 [Mycena sp. CBHHK59/15]
MPPCTSSLHAHERARAVDEPRNEHTQGPERNEEHEEGDTIWGALVGTGAGVGVIDASSMGRNSDAAHAAAGVAARCLRDSSDRRVTRKIWYTYSFRLEGTAELPVCVVATCGASRDYGDKKRKTATDGQL